MTSMVLEEKNAEQGDADFGATIDTIRRIDLILLLGKIWDIPQRLTKPEHPEMKTTCLLMLTSGVRYLEAKIIGIVLDGADERKFYCFELVKEKIFPSTIERLCCEVFI